jgi:FAD/FMN-containing dehydrogenase
LKFVSGTGRPISAGGRVMKNVAGYDVTRLLAGSAGTLGFITELTFRISSLPQCCRAVGARGSLEQCGTAAAWLLQSKLEPSFIVAVPDHPAIRVDGQNAWQLIAGFEGFSETVDSQVEGFQTWLRKDGLNCQSPWEFPARDGMCKTFFDILYRAPFVLRADLSPDRVAAVLAAQQGRTLGAAMLVDWGCGRITASWPDLAAQDWARWCAAAKTAEGSLVVEQAPAAFRERHGVFGTPRGDWKLTHKLKAALDPQGILAPGRLPGEFHMRTAN